MVNIQVDLDNKRNRVVDLYKAKYGLKNKQEVIEKLIDSVSKEFKDEEIKRDWRNDPSTDKQKFKLKELGIKFEKDLTKGEADILIKFGNKKPTQEEIMERERIMDEERINEELPDY